MTSNRSIVNNHYLYSTEFSQDSSEALAILQRSCQTYVLRCWVDIRMLGHDVAITAGVTAVAGCSGWRWIGSRLHRQTASSQVSCLVQLPPQHLLLIAQFLHFLPAARSNNNSSARIDATLDNNVANKAD